MYKIHYPTMPNMGDLLNKDMIEAIKYRNYHKIKGESFISPLFMCDIKTARIILNEQ